jgi:hypothetical protein
MDKIDKVREWALLVLVGLLTVFIFAKPVLTALKDRPRPADKNSLEGMYYTNGDKAFATLTNLKNYTQRFCGQGIVVSEGTETKSVIVCTTLEPYETKHVEAPYTPGAVGKMCPTQMGIGIDWEKCNFTFLVLPIN